MLVAVSAAYASLRQVLSREKHAYLKIIKSINSANAKQEMAEEAAAAAAAARSRIQVRACSHHMEQMSDEQHNRALINIL